MDIEEFFRDDWGLGRETIDATKGFITTASQAFRKQLPEPINFDLPPFTVRKVWTNSCGVLTNA
jgi:hypothetical protein